MFKKISISLFALIVLFSACNLKNKHLYDNMPEELATLCKAIDKSPKDAQLYYQRAQYYYENNSMDEALADALTSVKLSPEKSIYYILLSDIYFAKKETDLTEEMLEKAISLDPQNNEARLKLAELYFHLRMINECNVTLDEAIKLQSHNPKAYLIRAFCLKEQQDTTGYLRILQLVIDQDPREIKAYLELGYFYQSKLDPLAINYYENALQVDPNNKEIHFNLAKLYQDLGETEKAIEHYKILLSLSPNHIGALNNLGYIYLVNTDQYEEAVSMFTKVIDIDSTVVMAVCNRGIAFEYLKDYDKARQDYLYCKQLDVNYEPAILGLNRLDQLAN